MLSVITTHIETALLSYIKVVEESRSNHSSIEILVHTSEKLNAHRKRDILAIHALCEQALQMNETPRELIAKICDYLQTIRTGFLFFPGRSRFRECLYQAIEQYDLRYLEYRAGEVRLSETVFVTEGGHQAVDTHREQINMQLLQLNIRLDEQQAEIERNQELFSEANKVLIQLRQELDAARNENLNLKGELRALRRLNVVIPVGSVDSVASLDSGLEGPVSEQGSFSPARLGVVN